MASPSPPSSNGELSRSSAELSTAGAASGLPCKICRQVLPREAFSKSQHEKKAKSPRQKLKCRKCVDKVQAVEAAERERRRELREEGTEWDDDSCGYGYEGRFGFSSFGCDDDFTGDLSGIAPSRNSAMYSVWLRNPEFFYNGEFQGACDGD